jgi:hypothetical protein
LKLNGFSKVLIGIPDPNEKVFGDEQTRKWGLAVAYFPSKLADEIREINREFIKNVTTNKFGPDGWPKL